MKNEYITKSAEETQNVGEELGKSLQKGIIITLSGDLGYGKTTFVQGFAKGLGITHRIISPTFVVIRKYEIQIKNQIANNKNIHSKGSRVGTNPIVAEAKADKEKLEIFYHIDLYRMQSVHELESLGIKEILEDPEAVVMIEWPEKLGELLPEERIDVKFEYLGEDRRRISMEDIR